jgi:hypothetical protein
MTMAIVCIMKGAGQGGQGNFVRMAGSIPRRRMTIVQRAATQLNAGSEEEFSKYESDEDDGNTGNPILNDVRHEYRDETWTQEFFTYDPKPREFIGSRGPSAFFSQIPTILYLFHLFWPHTLLRKIVTETNRYATHPMDAQGNCMGGPKWKNLTIARLKAFLAIHMYMGMKRQPNMKSYWEREGSFFHCPTTSNIMRAIQGIGKVSSYHLPQHLCTHCKGGPRL